MTLSEPKFEKLYRSTDEATDAISCTTPTNKKATQRPRPPRIQASQQTYRSNNFRNGCSRCRYNHRRGVCPSKDKQCAGCGRLGHFIKMCRGYSSQQAPINEINIDRNQDDDVMAEAEVNATFDPDQFIGTVMNGINNNDNV